MAPTRGQHSPWKGMKVVNEFQKPLCLTRILACRAVPSSQIWFGALMCYHTQPQECLTTKCMVVIQTLGLKPTMHHALLRLPWLNLEKTNITFREGVFLFFRLFLVTHKFSITGNAIENLQGTKIIPPNFF